MRKGRATDLCREMGCWVVAGLCAASRVQQQFGDRIAFMSARGGDWEIFVMNADGTEARQLTDNDDSDTGPSWSPGGDRIVFTSNRDGDLEIFVMNADGADTYSTGQEGVHPDFGGPMRPPR